MIDLDGNVVGMAFVTSKRSIIAISTIMTCIKMWLKFRFVNPFCNCIDVIWLMPHNT